MNKLVTIILGLFVALASCSESKTKRPAAKVHLAEPITTEISKDTSLTDPDIHKTFPAYVQAAMAVLPDNYLIDVDHVIYGDFNADDKQDFSSKVTNLENGEQ